MDIYTILSSKPHNAHYLKRYWKFMQFCNNNKLDSSTKVEQHHICPKANDMFPEYKSFKNNSWNKANLTIKQHLVAHHLLWKAFGKSQGQAFYMMTTSKTQLKLTLKVIAKAKETFIANRKNMVTVYDTVLSENVSISCDEYYQFKNTRYIHITAGKPLSDVHKLKLSIKLRLKPHSKEHILNQANAQRGSKRTIESNLANSERNKNLVSAFDLDTKTNVRVSSLEFAKHRGTKYVGIMSKTARLFRIV